MWHALLTRLALGVAGAITPSILTAAALLSRITTMFVGREAAASCGEGHSWPYLLRLFAGLDRFLGEPDLFKSVLFDRGPGGVNARPER